MEVNRMNNNITYRENEQDKMVYIYKGNDIVATCNCSTKEITTYSCKLTMEDWEAISQILKTC